MSRFSLELPGNIDSQHMVPVLNDRFRRIASAIVDAAGESATAVSAAAVSADGTIAYNPNYQNAVSRVHWEKHGEQPSVLDWGARADAREISDAVTTALSPAISSAMANFAADDIGKVCHVAGAGGVGDDQAVMIDSWVRGPSALGTTSSNALVVIAETELDCVGATKIYFTVRSSINDVTWQVFGADVSDYSDETSIHGPANVPADTTSKEIVNSPGKRYYRVKIKSTVAGAHGTIYALVSAFGYLLVTTIAAVTDSQNATLSDTARTTVSGRRCMIATDNLAAIQNALDAIGGDTSRVLHFPAREVGFADLYTAEFPHGGAYYTSDRLVYQGQSLAGDGPLVSIIRGAPGKDVFYSPDPSIPETGAVVEFIVAMSVRDLRIVVDNTMDVSTAFPERRMLPTGGGWLAETAYAPNHWVTSAGKIYYATTHGTSGTTPPTHTAGNQSDGGVRWTYVGVQYYCGNAAFAFPVEDASSLASRQFILRPVVQNVEIWSPEELSSLGATGIWTQRPIYGGLFSNIYFHNLTNGYMECLPTSNFANAAYVPDVNTFVNISFVCLRPAVFFNGKKLTLNNFQIYATGGIDAESVHLLGARTAYRTGCSMFSVSNWYCEPARMATDVLTLMTGEGHRFIDATLKWGRGSGVVHIDSLNLEMVGGAIFNDGVNPVIKIYGNRVRIRNLGIFRVANFVEDYGFGNEVSTSHLYSEPLDIEQEIFLNGPLRNRFGGKDGDFAHRFVTSSHRNRDDLFITGTESLWIGPGTLGDKTVDRTLESNGYVSINGNKYTYIANKSTHMVGENERIPAGKCTVYTKVRGSAEQGIMFLVQVHELPVPPSNPTTLGILTDTTDGTWQTLSVEADFTSHSGKFVIFNYNPDADLDVAWAIVVPHFGALRSASLEIDDTLTLGGTPLLTSHDDEEIFTVGGKTYIFGQLDFGRNHNLQQVLIRSSPDDDYKFGLGMQTGAAMALFYPDDPTQFLDIGRLNADGDTISPDIRFSEGRIMMFQFVDDSDYKLQIGGSTIFFDYAANDPTEVVIRANTHVDQNTTPLLRIKDYAGNVLNRIYGDGNTDLVSLGVGCSDSRADPRPPGFVLIGGFLGVGTRTRDGTEIAHVVGDVEIEGDVNLDGDMTLALLTATRPLKIDGDKSIISEPIDLASADDITGTLALANGGTGAVDAAGARTNLAVYSTSEVYTKAEVDAAILAALPDTADSAGSHDHGGVVSPDGSHTHSLS